MRRGRSLRCRTDVSQRARSSDTCPSPHLPKTHWTLRWGPGQRFRLTFAPEAGRGLVKAPGWDLGVAVATVVSRDSECGLSLRVGNCYG